MPAPNDSQNGVGPSNNLKRKLHWDARNVRAAERWRPSWRELCNVTILSGCFGLIIQHAQAQDVNSSARSIFHRPELSRPHDSTDLHAPNEQNHQHVSLTGKPCIALQSSAIVQRINKNIYEHWIKASNGCGQNIKVQVCYHKTSDCIVMTVPPYEIKNAVLGIQPSMKEFQYDAKEK